jgi:hypothetical protein
MSRMRPMDRGERPWSIRHPYATRADPVVEAEVGGEVMKQINPSELSGFVAWWSKYGCGEAVSLDCDMDVFDDETNVRWDCIRRFAEACYIAGRRSMQSERDKKLARRRPPGR